ncbi:hypothetical protein [Bacteroides sp. 224]|uniref:hypothetical protein n=1 Tax=Bacteroides sp. 224 TaxID=2302936 RepID=UPI0013D5F1F5|nr:hypothetical protein [Bacteroides sp. 224]NDV65247.1 hypothetical protein [Bacteroides sp. 224]
MKNLFIKLFFTLGLVTLFASCQKDEEIAEKQEGGRLLFSMNAPSNGLLTRADEADATIETLYALYFIKASDGKFKYKDFEILKSSSVNKLVETTAGSGTQNSTYTYRILSGTDNSSNSYDSWFGPIGTRTNLNMKIVFVANATINSTTIASNTEMDVALPKLIVAKGTVNNSSTTAPIMMGTSIWPRDTKIPMYTVTDEVVIPYGPYIKDHYVGQSATSTGTAGVYNLIRMLAKIKISNIANFSTAGSTNSNPYNFEITKITVVNGLDKGYLPYMNGVNVVWNAANNRVTEVKTCPTGSSIFTKAGTAPAITTASGVQSVTFYLFETNKVLAKKTEAREEAANRGYCYLKLEGYRWPKAEAKPTSPTPVEYMLPIPLVTNLVASADYAGDVLRNHYYQFSIAGVNLYEVKAKIKVQNWSTVTGMEQVKPLPLR